MKKESKQKKKTKTLFAQILRQQFNEHRGAVWVMKFNYDGMLLATGGEDKVLRVWKVDENGAIVVKKVFSFRLFRITKHIFYARSVKL